MKKLLSILAVCNFLTITISNVYACENTKKTLVLSKDNVILKVGDNVYDDVFQVIALQSNGVYKTGTDVMNSNSIFITISLMPNIDLWYWDDNAIATSNEEYVISSLVLENDKVFLPAHNLILGIYAI